MYLIFTPQRRDETLVLVRSGDSLVINGQHADFHGMAPGEARSEFGADIPWLLHALRRPDGMLEVHLILPHGPEASEARRNPAPMALAEDGQVCLPGEETVSDTA